MAKLRGAAKAAFLRRMRKGRRQTLKPQRSRSRSKMAHRMKRVFHRRGGKLNIKKEAERAGIGGVIGTGIKYGVGLLAKNAGPVAQEWIRRGANVGAAVGGVPGELAYQIIDYGLNQVIAGQGGTPAGTLPGEAA